VHVQLSLQIEYLLPRKYCHSAYPVARQIFVGEYQFCNERNVQRMFEAEGILASVTVKVHVQVANGAHTVIAANRILHCAGAIINSMNE
jgi:hypothetical protein